MKVRRQKSTSFGSLQQHNAAAVATAARTRQRVPRAHGRTHTHGSPRQLRGSQFEYASSLAPAELVRNHHHHEIALRQVSTGRRGGRRRLVVDSPARRGGGRSLWELPNAPLGVVRPFIVDATTGERAWKRQSVSAPSCMWDLGRLGARLLGTSVSLPVTNFQTAGGPQRRQRTSQRTQAALSKASEVRARAAQKCEEQSHSR